MPGHGQDFRTIDLLPRGPSAFSPPARRAICRSAARRGGGAGASFIRFDSFDSIYSSIR